MNFIYQFYVKLRASFRVLKFFILMGIYFSMAGFHYLIASDPVDRRKRLTKNGKITANWILKIFNVRLICKEAIPQDEASLIVGNHLGFIDIVCLTALSSGVFITSMEMKNTPVLGQICDLAGCAYVNRLNRMRIQDELKDIIEVLKQGFSVMLYAESLSSNGEQVLPFKKTLITAAGYAGKPIRPFVFNYREVDGGPIKYEHQDSLCWYGDQSFAEAIWKSLKLNSIVCEIEFLPLVQTSQEEDRAVLAQRVHSMVSAKFVVFKQDMNSEEQTVLATGTASAY